MPKIINSIVKTLIMSDFFLNLGWGLLSPIFALFVLEKITINDPAKAAEVAGFAALSYWISKSCIEIPIGRFLDKTPGEKDDFWFMILGLFIVGITPLGYLMSTEPWHIYFFQVVHAVGMAMTLPSWLAIFTRHIDKGKEAFEWSMETTSISMGAGIAGGLGGVVASVFGFKILFVFVAVLTFFAATLLILIKGNIYPRIKDGVFATGKPVVEP